jgi:hypothetical protein
MLKLRTALLTGLLLCGGTVTWVGCGESTSSNENVMVKPDVPPAEANKDSMNAYLQSHPGAAKGAGKGMVPGK